jgi:hypothetical protein
LRGRWFIRRATSLNSVWLMVPKIGALGEELAYFKRQAIDPGDQS